MSVQKYNQSIIQKAKELRLTGKTYKEICTTLDLKIPKPTLSGWFKNVPLPLQYPEIVQKLNILNLTKARAKAAATNKAKREKLLQSFETKNLPFVQKITDPIPAKLALAMLCLGEAAKYSKSNFSLGSSDPRIIIIFLRLLPLCFDIQFEKFRCTVQCRADQDTDKLEKFWQELTNIPKNQFYKPQIDPRTIGKPTLKTNYKGVLKVNYLDNKIQLELETLYNLVYNQLL